MGDPIPMAPDGTTSGADGHVRRRGPAADSPDDPTTNTDTDTDTAPLPNRTSSSVPTAPIRRHHSTGAADTEPPTGVLRSRPRPTSADSGSENTENTENGYRDRSAADDGHTAPPRVPVIRNVPTLIWRTIVKAWDDSIVGWAAQAAFWQALSLPPLLLGLLGSVGYVAGWFGPDTVDVIYDRILSFANRTFSPSVVSDLIKPTVDNVLDRGRVGVVSVGFVLSLWAGSSAVSCFVASIVRAHDQHEVRNPVWQRIFALLLYLAFLTVSVPLLPLVALGPNYLRDIVPDSWDPLVTTAIDFGYFPFVALLLLLVLTTLYHLALPNPLPWHRLAGGAIVAGVVFWVASYFLRLYLSAITRAGYTYGALATPIAFLLFTFFLGFAIVIGAEFNAAVQSLWPAKPAVSTHVRKWVNHQTAEVTEQLKTLPERLSSGPIRRRDPDEN